MNEKDSPCVNTVVTVDLANCLTKARDAADAQLNAAYGSLRGRLDAAERQRLVATQRLWIQYRDSNCTAERDLYGGGTASSSATRMHPNSKMRVGKPFATRREFAECTAIQNCEIITSAL
jgi:uncharacterized protein YecT (DUF1311 family)